MQKNFKTKSDVSSRQGGFSLLEIMIGIVLLSLIMAFVYPALDGMYRFGEKINTHARMDKLANVISTAYAQHAMVIDSNATPKMTCLTSDCKSALVDTSAAGLSVSKFHVAPSATSIADANGKPMQQALEDISLAQGVTLDKLDTDGYNKHYWWFVSNRIAAPPSHAGGPTLYYHIIAIASSGGRNQLVGTPTFDYATGKLDIDPRNPHIVISGLKIERHLMQKTLDRMNRVSAAYAQVFSSAYLTSVDRNTAVDYFSADACPQNCTNQAMFDATSVVPNTAGNHNGWSYAGTPFPGDPASTDPPADTSAMLKDCQPLLFNAGEPPFAKAFEQATGLDHGTMQSAWQLPLVVCNGPDADGRTDPGGAKALQLRNPASSNAALQTPPYTAAIEAWLPGQEVLSVTVTGQY